MHYTKSIAFLIGLTIIVSSCSHSLNVLNFGDSDQIRSLIVNETYQADSAVYKIYNFAYGNAYGVSRDRRYVHRFNLNSKSNLSYRVGGEGPNKIGDVHTVYGVDSNRFVVHDKLGSYLYHANNGKYSFACDSLYSQINIGRLPSGFFLSGTSVMVSSLNPHLPMRADNYYADPSIFFFAKINLKTCQTFTGGEIVKPSPYYDQLLTIRQRALIEKISEESMLMYFQYDRNVQIINVEDFEVQNIYRLSTEFKDLVSAQDWSLQEMSKLAQVNPAYLTMKVTQDGRYLITQYIDGENQAQPSTEYYAGTIERPARYFEVYDLKQKKRIGKRVSGNFQDIDLVEAISLDEIYLATNFFDGEEGTFILKASFLEK